MVQLHKEFTDSQVKELIERYLKREIRIHYVLEILGIKRSRFFVLLKQYKECPDKFSIQYFRNTKTRTIPQAIEGNIIRELQIEKNLIEDPEIPLRHYNYSYVKDLLETKHNQKVSLPTIIDRAKKNDFYLKRKPKKASHDREVVTNHIGEIIQHDSSYHLWSPAAKEKWYLVTSLDDFSRFILYATLLRKETSWAHILALQTVVLKYGSPEAANEAMKKGVADFITKPFRKDTIVFTMNRVLELARVRRENLELKKRLDEKSCQ